MAQDRGMHKETPIGDLTGARLGPAETHDIVRRRLARMTGQWGLEPSDTYRLARLMRTYTYIPGEVIVPRGTRADCLGLVVRGQVAVHVGRRGATRQAAVLLPGSTFGEMMLYEGRPSSATLKALTESEIRFLRRADLQSLRDERQKERQIASLWKVVRASAVLLAALVVIVVALSQPAGRQALALVPMGIGQWCDDRGHEYCAWSAWRATASLTPADPNPHLALGAFHFRRGAMAEAERAFEQARALAPDLPETYNNLGLIYARQGLHQQAIDAFQRALELEPGIAATEHNLALSLQASQNYGAAIEHYRAALALGEPQSSTLLNMAIAYYEAQQPDKAEEMAKQALAMDPNLAPAHTLLGVVALEARQAEKALPHLHHAISVDAGYGPAHFFLGLAYKSLGQPAEAVTSFEQALVNASDEATRVRIRRHLAELYETQDQGRAE